MSGPGLRPRAAGEGLILETRSAVSVGKALDAAGAALAPEFDDPRRHARRLLMAALDLSAAAVFAHPERVLSVAERARFAAMLRRALAHEPLSRIVGKREFWGLEFGLGAETLDPRPDSETVIETALSRLPDRTARHRFLDLGTGTGCLLLALLSEFSAASGVGVDVAPAAVRTARQNAARLGLGDRAQFIAGDWLQAIAGRFDVVVANPPYIASALLTDLPPEVRDYDPKRALDGGTDGVEAYRAIAAGLPRVLSPGGIVVAEIGIGQADAVAAILARSGLLIDGFEPDLAGIARCVVARR